MALTPGTRLGVYDISAQIGEGGMGQVYRARDTRLLRDVALKVLPDSLANDPDRLARFTREAQTLAALNHPHIAHIHGLEESGAVRALVMELVEGDDLSTRVARGAIPIDEALPIAKQIAEALEAAHEQGIIHRDLKPANIKVRPDGTVKVLDFGLAKALGPEGAGATADAMASPTFTTPVMTQAGMIVGTAAYMSPEQARGKIVDKRADIWAFGCVLYEMLTGTRAFAGEDASDTLAAVLRGEPDWTRLPPTVPPALGAYLKRCLHKDPRQRIHDIADVRLALEGAFESAGQPIPAPTTASRWRRMAAMTGVALAFAAATGAAVWVAVRPAEPVPPRVSRLSVALPSATALTINGNDRDLAITPDGSRLAYVGNQGTQLFVRGLDALAPTAVFTGGPRGPFFSPDGQWIGFSDNGLLLKKVAVTGGPALTLATLEDAVRGAAWGPEDTIIVGTFSAATGLRRVVAAGGATTVITRPDRSKGEGYHVWPELLPGGRAVLFTITAAAGGFDAAQVAVLDLQTLTHRILVRGGSHAHFVPSGIGSTTGARRDGGYLVYAAAGTLWAVAFDLATLATHGTPVPAVPDVLTTTAYGALDAVVSADGTLAYVSGAAQAAARTLVWVDRNGHEVPIKAPSRAYVYPRLSPDGTRVAVEVRDQEWDIWIVNLVNTTFTPFSFGPSPDRLPVWTPDGRRIIWSSERAGVSNLYWQAADGSGAVEQLTRSSTPQYLSAISPDGAQLVVRQDAPTRDLMIVAVDKTAPQTDVGHGQPSDLRAVRPLIATAAAEASAEISRDGRWIAYQSNESGRDEIYVRPFPDVNAGHWPVSIGGGAKPLWAPDGRELFYLVPSGGGTAVMSASVARGASFSAGTPTKVLEGPYFFGTPGGGDTSFRTYDVSPDGRRLLMIKLPGSAELAAAPPSLIVVQHWIEELKRLVPTK